MPIMGRFSTCCQTQDNCLSTSVPAGSTPAGGFWGAGSLRLSTLPFPVSGIAGRPVKEAGIMWSGSLADK